MSVVGLVLGSEERREGLRKAGIARAAEFSWGKMAEETGEDFLFHCDSLLMKVWKI